MQYQSVVREVPTVGITNTQAWYEEYHSGNIREERYV
ncbi:hypothetical protein SAMN05444376_1158 [Bacteroides clarus YIT 12056]|nr:hypothetical protein SAMN05444376_1158 [Bacteroides clarus YIT 12056]